MKITVRERLINVAPQLQLNPPTPPFNGASYFSDRCIIKELNEQNARPQTPDDHPPNSEGLCRTTFKARNVDRSNQGEKKDE